MVAPLLVFTMIALGVRSRRATANFALIAPLAALVGVALSGWAGLAKPGFYDGRYEWINVATAFSGPAQFQNYVVNIGIRVSHLTTVLMLAVLAISFVLLVWSRVGARSEPSAARYYGLLTLLLAATLGVVASTDLSELYVFWAVGGVATYLLLSNQWADGGSTAAARLALAAPALADLALLAGIALLFSRYGQLSLDQLIPVLHSTVGAGPKALATACVLIFVGAAGRIGLFPFHGWLTGAANAPTGALAAAQGFWCLMAAGLLYKVVPIFASANPIPLRTIAAAAAVSAVLLPLLGLAGLDARRTVTAAGIAVSALAVLAFARPLAVAPAAILLAVTGLARVAAVLAMGSLVAGMRSPLVTEMGEGFRRMRVAVLTLALAGIAMAAAVGQVAGSKLPWYWTLAYSLGLALAMLALFRVYFVAAHGQLPRRRGFDPNRVRPGVGVVAVPPPLLALLALALAAALFSSRFVGHLDNLKHGAVAIEVTLAWIGAALAGIVLAGVLFWPARRVGESLAGGSARLWAGIVGSGGDQLARLLVGPAVGLAAVAEERALAGGELSLGRAIEESGGLLRRRAPVLPLVIGLTVLAAAAAAIAAPGVYR